MPEQNVTRTHRALQSILKNLSLTAAVSGGLFGTALASAVQSEYTIEAGAKEIGPFSVETDRLRNSTGAGDLVPGDNEFDYVSQRLSPEATGEYSVGQSQAPVDTVVLLYEGSFDPEDGSRNFVVLNDDFGGFGVTDPAEMPDDAICGSGRNRCPALKTELEQGDEYTLVISTFRPTDGLALPLSFFAIGPGRVLFEPAGDNFFEQPVTGRSSQGAGAYLDRVVANTGNVELRNSLSSLRLLSESDARAFVESTASNRHVAGSTELSGQLTGSQLAAVRGRFTSVGLGGVLSGVDGVATLAARDARAAMAALGGASVANAGSSASGLLASAPREASPNRGGELAHLGSALNAAGLSDKRQGGVWGESYYLSGDGDDYDYRARGGLFGIDTRLDEQILAGGFIGIGDGRVAGEDVARARVDSEILSGGAYGAYVSGPWVLNATLQYAHSDNENRRRVVTGNTATDVQGDNTVRETAISMGGQYVVHLSDGWEVAPTAQITHSWLKHSAYTEEGNSAYTLRYEEQSRRIWRTSLGVDAGYLVNRTDDSRLRVFGGLAWGWQEGRGDDTRAFLSADPASGSFTAPTDDDSRHSADLSLGVDWERELAGETSVALRVAAESSHGGSDDSSALRLGAAYRW